VALENDISRNDAAVSLYVYLSPMVFLITGLTISLRNQLLIRHVITLNFIKYNQYEIFTLVWTTGN
jgi:hypothetical protein